MDMLKLIVTMSRSTASILFRIVPDIGPQLIFNIGPDWSLILVQVG